MKPIRIMYLITAGIIFSAGYIARADLTMADIRNQAVQGAVDKAQAELSTLQVARDKTIGILPMGGDANREVEQRLMTALTRAGFTVVEARNDPLWDEIMREIEWGDRKQDIVDEATLVKFGQLKGMQAVLYGNVHDLTRPGRMVFVEIELHISSLQTRQHLWGGRFAERRYTAGEMRGVVDLDSLVRRALQSAVADAVKTLVSAPAMSTTRSAALLPLAGDLDGYATGLISDAVTAAGNVTLRELDVRTLGEARALLRDQPTTADAVLVGAVRDLTPRYLVHDEIFQRTFKAEAEVQLRIEDAVSGDILWSGTGNAMVEEVEKEPTIPLVNRLFKEYPKVFIGIGIFLAIVIVWGAFKRSMTRVR